MLGENFGFDVDAFILLLADSRLIVAYANDPLQTSLVAAG
jgi:hypothetical protein